LPPRGAGGPLGRAPQVRVLKFANATRPGGQRHLSLLRHTKLANVKLLMLAAERAAKVTTMPDSEFEDLVRKYAERQKQIADGNTVDWENRRRWWQARASQLFDQIGEWLAPLIQAGSVSFERPKVPLHEDDLGAYEIESGIIRLGPDKIVLKPVGSVIVGGFGRIDVEGPNTRAMLLLTFVDPTIPPTERRAKASWFVVYPLLSNFNLNVTSQRLRPQRRELRPLTKEVFQELFTAAFGISE